MGWNEAKPETKARLEARYSSLPVSTEMSALVRRDHECGRWLKVGSEEWCSNF